MGVASMSAKPIDGEHARYHLVRAKDMMETLQQQLMENYNNTVRTFSLQLIEK
jgi:hypothetical protein